MMTMITCGPSTQSSVLGIAKVCTEPNLVNKDDDSISLFSLKNRGKERTPGQSTHHEQDPAMIQASGKKVHLFCDKKPHTIFVIYQIKIKVHCLTSHKNAMNSDLVILKKSLHLAL
jgi:hypothetical protein